MSGVDFQEETGNTILPMNLSDEAISFILMKEKEGDVKPPTKMKIKDNNLEDIIAILRYVNSMEIKRLKKAMQEQFSKSNKESEQVGFKTIWNEKY